MLQARDIDGMGVVRIDPVTVNAAELVGPRDVHRRPARLIGRANSLCHQEKEYGVHGAVLWECLRHNEGVWKI
jgi:hypothetical protein